jgi:hypothetical protein
LLSQRGDLIMNRLVNYRWLDEDNRVVQVTEKIGGVLILIAHVDLNNGLVETIDADFVEQTKTVTPVDQTRLLQMASDWERRQYPYPKNIRWYKDGLKFETLRESHEWAHSVIYNEIGHKYDGYVTEDEKIAYSLVYELNRCNTFNGKSVNVFVHEEYKTPDGPIIYRIWILRTASVVRTD